MLRIDERTPSAVVRRIAEFIPFGKENESGGGRRKGTKGNGHGPLRPQSDRVIPALPDRSENESASVPGDTDQVVPVLRRNDVFCPALCVFARLLGVSGIRLLLESDPVIGDEEERALPAAKKLIRDLEIVAAR